ncbi:MAG: ABC transporter permease subunit [Bowdeniella nasicola]|nr:ABC transporter permease subunit [Bowdeniella nasicola]
MPNRSVPYTRPPRSGSPDRSAVAPTSHGVGVHVPSTVLRGEGATLGSTRQPSRLAWHLIGWGVILLSWALLAQSQLDYILPGPLRTWDALVQLFTSEGLVSALILTMERAALGLVVAIAIGIAWGFVNSRSPRLHWMTMPVLQILMSTPGIIFVIVAMVWFGTNALVVVFVVAAVTVPLLTSSTTQAFTAIDADLMEMATVFRLSRSTVIRHIMIPTIAPPILAAGTVALGQSIRVSVMAELLATASGIGADIRLAQINIETPDIFAYAAVMTALTFSLEALLVAPVKRRLSAHLATSDGSKTIGPLN